MNDIELTVAALEACGYRVKVRERSGTQWVTVAGVHWHPLTNISQAMQLLQDGELYAQVGYYGVKVYGDRVAGVHWFADSEPTPAALINAQCRAIVTACASLKPVR